MQLVEDLFPNENEIKIIKKIYKNSKEKQDLTFRIFNENSLFSEEELKRFKSKYEQMIKLPFNEKTNEGLINIKTKDIIKNFDSFEVVLYIVKAFFKNQNINMDEIIWTGVYHTNTDTPHIHLLFWNKKLEKGENN